MPIATHASPARRAYLIGAAPTACLSVIALAVMAPATALAHAGAALAPHDVWTAWELAPPVLALLSLTAWGYARGVRTLWARAGRGRGISRAQAALFAAGWTALALALVSPLHALGGVLFGAHMGQHVVLVAVAPLLLVLGRPQVAGAWALPARWRARAGRGVRLARRQPTLAAAASVGGATLLHAVAMLGWHVPAAYEMARRHEGWHALQHLSFYGTALLFWWAVVGAARHRRHGAALLAVFVTALYSGVLGALLVTASHVWYPGYVRTAGAWGFTPLEDQQLGGLLMWVPANLAYVAMALWLVRRALADSDRAWVPRLAPAARAVPLALAPLLALACGSDARIAAESGDVRQGDPGALERTTVGAAARGVVAVTGGDPARGPAHMLRYGCQGCHVIPGVPNAYGQVGPPLTGMADRVYVAGLLPNNPENLAWFLRAPQQVLPGGAMPDMRVSEADARDMTAYLHTLRAERRRVY